MIFGMDTSKDLIEKLYVAQQDESVATKILFSALENGIKDDGTLSELSKRMAEAHSNTTNIWEQLQQYRLDV